MAQSAATDLRVTMELGRGEGVSQGGASMSIRPRMTQCMQALASEIIRLQGELDREIEARRKSLGVSIRSKIVDFEHGIAMEHRSLRRGLAGFLAKSSIATGLTAPVISLLIVPMVLVDFWVSFYQQVCFRGYAIPRVRRSAYILFDRRHLGYLNGIEKLNCLCCACCKGGSAISAKSAVARSSTGARSSTRCPCRNRTGATTNSWNLAMPAATAPASESFGSGFRTLNMTIDPAAGREASR